MREKKSGDSENGVKFPRAIYGGESQRACLTGRRQVTGKSTASRITSGREFKEKAPGRHDVSCG